MSENDVENSIEKVSSKGPGVDVISVVLLSVVGGYEQVQAHLWSRATTFYALPVPFLRQVSKIIQMGV